MSARRKRNYGKDKNNLGIFINNALVDSAKRKKLNEKAQAAAEKKLAREEERDARQYEAERARSQRLEEKEKIAHEKALRKKAEMEDKVNIKLQKIYVRLEADMSKMGLFPSNSFISDTSREALRISVPASKVCSYFILDNEEVVSRQCAHDFLEEQGISREHSQLKYYKQLLDIIAVSRPQLAATKNPNYTKTMSNLLSSIQEIKGKSQRKTEIQALIESLSKSKKMFKDELYDFWEIAESNDWGRSKALSSVEYKTRIANKASYLAEIRSMIYPIKML